MTTMKWTGFLTMVLLAAAWSCSELWAEDAAAPAKTGTDASLPNPGGASATPSAGGVAAAPTPTVTPLTAPPKDITSYCLGVQMARGYKKQEIEVDLDAMTKGLNDAAAGKDPADAADATKAMTTPPAPKGKVGYGAGYAVAKGLAAQGAELDCNALAQGMKDVLENAKLRYSDDEVKMAIEALTTHLILLRRANYNVQAADNKKASEEFMAANKTKDGVVTLPDGLQYKILKEGSGPKPAAADSVVVNYRATLVDGKEVFNTYTDKEPTVIKLSDPIIVGLREGLKMMPVGSKWQLFIPSRLGYLWKGRGTLIPPNAALIYDVELVSIK